MAGGRRRPARYLRVDGRPGERVADLDRRLLKAGDTPYEHALAIQDYLRTSGGFTYSLTLRTASDCAGRRPTSTRSAAS